MNLVVRQSASSMETRPTNSLATCVTLDQDGTLRFYSKERADKMQEPTQYRIVEVDNPVYGSRYVIQYAHRTFFRNRLVWKDLFINRGAAADDAIFFSFLTAQQALARHIDKENYDRGGEGDNNPTATAEHEGFTDDGDIDF